MAVISVSASGTTTASADLVHLRLVRETGTGMVWPTMVIHAYFDEDPATETSGSPTELRDRVTGWRTTYGIQYELGEAQARTTDLDIRDQDEALNPANTNSAYNTSPKALRVQRRITGSAIWRTDVYQLFADFIERYPVKWTAKGFHGWTTMEATDGQATLTTLTPDNILPAEILNNDPLVFFPCSDDVATGQATDRSGYFQPPLAPYKISNGGSVTFGSDVLGVDSETSVRLDHPLLTGLSSAWTSTRVPGYYSGYGVNDPGNRGFTVEFWIKAPARSSATDQPIINWGQDMNGNFTGTFPLQFSYTPGAGDDVAGFTTLSASGSGPTSITGATPVFDGDWHHVLLYVERITFGLFLCQMDLYVDGVKDATSISFNWEASTRFTLDGLTIWDTVSDTQFNVANLAVYGHGPGSLSQITDHYLAGKTGFAGEKAGARIKRILNAANYPSRYRSTLSTGVTPLGPAVGLSATDALTQIKEIASTDLGLFYIGPNGRPTYRDRDYLYTHTDPAWVLGENEHPYAEDITYDYDLTYVYNEATITDDDGIWKASDLTSQDRYFRRTFTRTIKTFGGGWGQVLAQHILNRYGEPRPRVSNIKVTPSTNVDLWDLALGAQIGDRVRVLRRTSAFTMDQDYILLGVAHTVTPQEWSTALQLGPVLSYQPWILGNTLYGVLGFTTITTY